MSSSRNKRKRADVEVPLTMVTAPARRRGPSGAEPTDPEAAATTAKNEANAPTPIAAPVASSPAPGTNLGETSSAPGTTTQPQHTEVTPTNVQVTTMATGPTAAIKSTPEEEKKQETNNARNKPAPTNDAMIKREPPRKASNARSNAVVGSTTPPAAPAATQNVPMGGPSGASTPRASRIKSLISHRKLLLDRVRSGRTAARGRVVDMARNEAQAAKQATASMGESSRGNAALPAKPAAPLSEKARDEAEIAAFKKLSKSALQTAKKQRAENSEGGQEKRSSVSLRRGASVGKKMNAALSTLAPERTGSAAVVASGTAPSQPLYVAAAVAAVGSEKTTSQAAAGQPTPVPVQRQASTTAMKLPTHQYATQPTGKKLKVTQGQAPKGPPASAVVEAIPKMARSGSQKAIKSSAASAASRGTTSGAGMALPGQPLHTGLSAPGLPTNRLAQRAPVVCREAVALRERKKAIQSKLASLLQKRSRDWDQNDSRGSDSFPATMGTTTQTMEPSKKRAVFQAAAKQHPDPPSRLPCRRKTHWDNVLQEMKWMATDFVEERKWKVCAARTLSSAVQSTGTSAVKSKTSEDRSVRSSTDPSSSAKGANGVSKEGAAVKSAPNDTKQVDKTTTSSPPEAATATSKAAAVPTTTGLTSATKLRSDSYHKPTTDDAAKAKKVARIVSSMAFEVGSASLRAGALASSDLVHLKALERHVEKRKEIETGHGEPRTEKTEEASKAQDEVVKSPGENQASQEADPNDKKSQAGSFKRISKAVDNLLESFTSSPRRPPKRKSTSGGKGDGDDFALTSKQLEIIDFIEKKWGQSKTGAGAILTGSKASGKTIAVCSLLWKQRANGAQLLVCSPYRAMKWKHELKSFKPLQIQIFGLAAGISTPQSDSKAISSFGPNAVVVCEYSDFQRLKQEDLGRFETIIIDCRYPRGFLGSRFPSRFDTSPLGDQTPMAVPPELISESWWENIVEMTAKSPLNCMIIENPDRSTFLSDSIDKTEMQRVELISLRAAFLLGARLFASPNSSVKKRILTWARRRTKETAKTTTNNKVKEVQEFLLELMRPFSFEANSETRLEHVSHKAGKRLDLEVRPCAFSPAERSEYDKCCIALRGALSFKISRADESSVMQAQNHRSISDALLCLRRYCFHSQTSSLLASKPVRLRLGSPSYPNGDGSLFRSCDVSADHRILARKVTDSASQTDIELASQILEGSAKLRELVTILRNECEYQIEAESAIASFLQEPDKPRRAKQTSDQNSPKSPKKVVILAVLPEVQIIVSVLLNCIGLAHELLLRPSRFFCPSASDITIDLPEKQGNASTLAWVECQQALSRFNSVPSPESGETLNLLIASPDMVAGDHGGIGIDLADFVISVDEDWSGRNELIMRSLVAGLIPRNLRVKDKGCQLLKLVCESTCEENFLSAGPRGARVPLQAKEGSQSWPWPLDMFGRFLSSHLNTNQKDLLWPEREHEDAMFAFPALNLLRLRDQPLSEVLGVESLPPLLDLGSSISFLPQEAASNGDDTSEQLHAAEISLLKHIMKTEDSAHTLFKESGTTTSCPPLSHGNAVTRQDMPVLATRLYLEHFQKSKHVSPSTDQGVSAVSMPRTFAEQSTNALPSPSDSAEVVSSQDIGGAIPDPLGLASSLLVYNPLEKPELPPTTAKASSPLLSSGKEGSTRRVNSYTGVFQSSNNLHIHDGKQGSEPLVYFPPLLPRLLNCAIQAKRDIEAMRGRNSRRATWRGVHEMKRPAETAEDQVVKRMKVENPMGMVDAVHPSMMDSALSPAGLPTPITEGEAADGDAATLLLDIDEDFGLAGIGAIPLLKDAVLESSTTHVEVSSHYLDPCQNLLQTESLERFLPCDAEELHDIRMHTGPLLKGVILFTARKKRPYSPLLGTSSVYRAQHSAADAGWPSQNMHAGAVPLPGPGNGVFHHEINGAHNSAKKGKKKATTPAASAAFARPPADVAGPPHAMAQAPMSAQMVKAKEMFRNRIVAFLSARQKAMGMTLFESPAFVFAAVRFRNLFNERVPRMNWALYRSQKIGPGLPMMPESQSGFADYAGGQNTSWTSIVKRLKSQSTTGDDARAIAETQSSSLRRSLSAPSRVDFGPFQCGFLLSLSGMTGISPPRSRSGVSLPMGVKVPLLREQHQQSWSENEDQKLRGCTGRYGMNWILASRLEGGFDDVAHRSDQPPSHRRSARNCRDRWQALARSDPSLAREVQMSERQLRATSSMGTPAIARGMNESIRLALPIEALGTPGIANEVDEEVFLVPTKEEETSDDATHKTTEIADNSKATDNHHKDEVIPEAPDDSKMMDIDATMELEDMLAGAGGAELDAMDFEPLDLESTDIHEPKKPFKFLMSAKAKKQSVPMTIPGVVAGSQPSFVASHPSHQQSVQSSIAATWTNGRTEMWPLQFLDVAEKQRNAKAAAAASETLAKSKSSTSSSRSPAAGRSPQAATGAPSAARASAQRAVSGSGRPPPTSSGRQSSSGRGPAVPVSSRSAAASSRSSGSGRATSTGATSSSPRTPAVPRPATSSSRAPAGGRPHPVAPGSRAQSAGVPYGSPVMKYHPHPQSGGHYAPMPHPHAGAHPHAGNPHHPHHHQHPHQRMVPSPAQSRTPRAAGPPQPKHAAHTPVKHSGDMTTSKASPAPAPTKTAPKSAPVPAPAPKAAATAPKPASAPARAPVAPPTTTPASVPARGRASSAAPAPSARPTTAQAPAPTPAARAATATPATRAAATPLPAARRAAPVPAPAPSPVGRHPAPAPAARPTASPSTTAPGARPTAPAVRQTAPPVRSTAPAPAPAPAPAVRPTAPAPSPAPAPAPA